MDLTPGINQTKKWRKEQSWYATGKSNECEKYQKTKLAEILGVEVGASSGERINNETGAILHIPRPFSQKNAFELTEDFDAKVELNNLQLYINLKFVCEPGGAQTRSLALVYKFIKAQVKFIKCRAPVVGGYGADDVLFINIIDGDEGAKKMEHLQYALEGASDVAKASIYIGDLYNFRLWWEKKINV